MSAVNVMQMRLSKVIGKIAGNKLLLTLRDTFIMASAPIMIAGFAIMISSVFVDPNGIIFGESGLGLGEMIAGSWEAWETSAFAGALRVIQEAANLFLSGTLAINALLVTVGFAYFGTRRFFPTNKEPVLVVLYTLGSLFIVLPWTITSMIGDDPVTVDGYVDSNFLGQQGIFTGLLVAGVTMYVFNTLLKKNIGIKMPESVPPAVAKSFESLVPGAATLLLFVVIATVFAQYDTTLPEAMLALIQEPALAISRTPFFAVVAMTTTPILQWFGIHASSVWGPIYGLTWDINSNENVLGTGQHVYSTLFMNFTVVSSGALTIAPILAMLLYSKRAEAKSISRVAAAPGVFNISEPVTYGFPIVLNPVLFVPYFLSWLVPFFFGSFLTQIGLLPIISNNVPWTVPPIISGFLYSGSWSGALYQVFVIFIVVLMYLPFVRIGDKLSAEGFDEALDKGEA